MENIYKQEQIDARLFNISWLVSSITDYYPISFAPDSVKFCDDMYEYVLPISDDHVAYLYLDKETYEYLHESCKQDNT